VSNRPLCPVTGEPAVRLVQWVEAGLLVDLWRAVFRVDARPSFGSQQRFGLWQSPTGLYFFEPALEGDPEFYRRLYRYLIERKVWSHDAVRNEFDRAAARIRPGDRVLDVGCGDASFQTLVPLARYVGLDPSASGAVAGVSDQALSEHLNDHADSYDAVCAFQVLEHVADPRQMFLDMVRAAKPGGLVIVSVPHVPSAMTRIPNFLINAPPHHLTWWTEAALAALAKRSGASVESIETTTWNGYDGLVHWIARCSPIRCRDTHYHGAWSWHIAALIGFLLGRLVHAIRPCPTTADEGSSLVMVARRAG
jgi:SAM-dependent methyltransferase